jgi:hypothetical protein
MSFVISNVSTFFHVAVIFKFVTAWILLQTDHRSVQALCEMFQGSWVSKLYFLNNPLILRVNQLYLFSGYEVTQLVGALRYKAEARGFDSWWRDWDFLFTSSFRPHYDRGIDSASDRKAPRIICTSKILEPNKTVHADIVQKSSKFSSCLCFSLFKKKWTPT